MLRSGALSVFLMINFSNVALLGKVLVFHIEWFGAYITKLLPLFLANDFPTANKDRQKIVYGNNRYRRVYVLSRARWEDPQRYILCKYKYIFLFFLKKALFENKFCKFCNNLSYDCGVN